MPWPVKGNLTGAPRVSTAMTKMTGSSGVIRMPCDRGERPFGGESPQNLMEWEKGDSEKQNQILSVFYFFNRPALTHMCLQFSESPHLR